MKIIRNKVIVSRAEVEMFNSRWPYSELRDQSYWFEFDEREDLIDTNIPEQDDGGAALALSQDCQRYLFNDETPEWLR